MTLATPRAAAAANLAVRLAAERAAALRAFGVDGPMVDELLAYGASPLATAPLPPLPLADEPCAAVWDGYAAEAANPELGGAAATLCQHLVQLRFPVADGVSSTLAYLAATRRGHWHVAPPPEAWPQFADPDGLVVFVHPTVVGPLAVVAARARDDFERLVRALTGRNEPSPVRAATGATLVAGLTNWSRVGEARRQWAAARAGERDTTDAAWQVAFAELAQRRERYQDRLVLLSDGPYSAVPAAEVGLAPAAWRSASLVIRLEHECAHYATQRLFGTMRNALADELLADRAGIVAAYGAYRPDWARRFLGLEQQPDGTITVRPDGRLHAYRGTPALSDRAFGVLAEVAWRAVGTIGAFERARVRAPDPRRDALEVLVALARTPAELMAGEGGLARLHAAHTAARAELRAAEAEGAATRVMRGAAGRYPASAALVGARP